MVISQTIQLLRVGLRNIVHWGVSFLFLTWLIYIVNPSPILATTTTTSYQLVAPQTTTSLLAYPGTPEIVHEIYFDAALIPYGARVILSGSADASASAPLRNKIFALYVDDDVADENVDMQVDQIYKGPIKITPLVGACFQLLSPMPDKLLSTQIIPLPPTDITNCFHSNHQESSNLHWRVKYRYTSDSSYKNVPFGPLYLTIITPDSVVAPTVTPSPVEEPSPTPTIIIAPSPTATPTTRPTITPTSAPTSAPWPTTTPTPTVTPATNPTHTPSITTTPTPTVTTSPLPPHTITPSSPPPTPSPPLITTPTATPHLTAIATPTPTATPPLSPTHIPTMTPSPSPTSAPTPQPTAMLTPQPSSPTPTFDPMPSPTQTPTHTSYSPTPTMSGIAQITIATQPSPTPTSTTRPTPTQTPQLTLTLTQMSPTPTPTPNTPTPTSFPTTTPTVTPIQFPTVTPTPPASPPQTNTAFQSPSFLMTSRESQPTSFPENTNGSNVLGAYTETSSGPPQYATPWWLLLLLVPILITMNHYRKRLSFHEAFYHLSAARHRLDVCHLLAIKQAATRRIRGVLDKFWYFQDPPHH